MLLRLGTEQDPANEDSWRRCIRNGLWMPRWSQPWQKCRERVLRRENNVLRAGTSPEHLRKRDK